SAAFRGSRQSALAAVVLRENRSFSGCSRSPATTLAILVHVWRQQQPFSRRQQSAPVCLLAAGVISLPPDLSAQFPPAVVCAHPWRLRLLMGHYQSFASRSPAQLCGLLTQ